MMRIRGVYINVIQFKTLKTDTYLVVEHIETIDFHLVLSMLLMVICEKHDDEYREYLHPVFIRIMPTIPVYQFDIVQFRWFTCESVLVSRFGAIALPNMLW